MTATGSSRSNTRVTISIVLSPIAPGRNRIRDAIEVLRPDQSHGSARRRVAAVVSRIVRRDALCKVVARRRAYIVGAVGAEQNVDKCAHEGPIQGQVAPSAAVAHRSRVYPRSDSIVHKSAKADL